MSVVATFTKTGGGGGDPAPSLGAMVPGLVQGSFSGLAVALLTGPAPATVKVFRQMVGNMVPNGWAQGETLVLLPGGDAAPIGGCGGQGPVYGPEACFYLRPGLHEKPTLVNKELFPGGPLVCVPATRIPDPQPIGTAGTIAIYIGLESAPPGTFTFQVSQR